MLFSTERLSAIAALASLAAAAPAPASLNARACQSVQPSLIIPIRSDFPDAFYGSHPSVQVLNTVGTPAPETLDTLLRFDGIPSGAYGCQLVLNLPDTNNVPVSGAAQLNVFSVDRQTTLQDTWNNSPQKTTLFGSVNFDDSIPAQRFISSQACNTSLSYRLEIADLTRNGSITFPQSDAVGFQVLYNC